MIDDQGRGDRVTRASLGSGEPFAQRHAGRGMPLVRTGATRAGSTRSRTRMRLAWTLHPAGLAP
jgi:hypothetical protein